MGPCMSVLDAAGVNLAALPAQGPYAMSSEESLSFLTSKATFDTNGAGKPFSKLVDLRGGSHTLAKAFGLSPGGTHNCFMYVNKAECTVSKDAKPLNGATVDVSENELQLWYCQGAPISMPVGCVKSSGGANAILPRVHAVDVYLEVDGEARTDGHVCYGSDANLSRDKAIDAAVKGTMEGELWMKDFLKKGPSDGSKPWATIVQDNRWASDDGYVYLPLMANDVDNALMGDDKLTYVHSLMAKWAQLMAKVGAGTHSFSIRIRPRGVIYMDEDGEPMCGDTIGGGSSRDSNDAVAAMCGEHLTDPNAPGMSAIWTMTLDAAQASGKGPVRKAQEFANWPADEIEECIEMAMKFANKGVCGRKAAEMAPKSKCCHIILSEGDQGAGIKTARYGSGEREYDFFCAWALFKSADGKPDSLGAQIKFVVKKKTIVNYRPVDEDWYSGGFETANASIESVTALTITNAEIDAAIKRDAQYY